jgi:hypothetical protein
MIYTCYEMIRDCRADKPEGWSYLISQYVSAVRKLLTHYAPRHPVESVLVALRKPESSLFQSLEPAPERWFVADLRQKVLAELPVPAPDLAIDLETVASALESLTVLEKQVAWLEAMRYGPADTGVMMRMAPATVEKIRARAGDLIRGKVDAWNPHILADNGLGLGRAAAAIENQDCLPVRCFLDMLDGRTTWQERERMERHITACWHCVDHFCRMVEVVHLMRGLQPLSQAEAEPYRKILGLPAQQVSSWKRLLGRA